MAYSALPPNHSHPRGMTTMQHAGQQTQPHVQRHPWSPNVSTVFSRSSTPGPQFLGYPTQQGYDNPSVSGGSRVKNAAHLPGIRPPVHQAAPTTAAISTYGSQQPGFDNANTLFRQTHLPNSSIPANDGGFHTGPTTYGAASHHAANHSGAQFATPTPPSGTVATDISIQPGRMTSANAPPAPPTTYAHMPGNLPAGVLTLSYNSLADAKRKQSLREVPSSTPKDIQSFLAQRHNHVGRLMRALDSRTHCGVPRPLDDEPACTDNERAAWEQWHLRAHTATRKILSSKKGRDTYKTRSWALLEMIIHVQQYGVRRDLSNGCTFHSCAERLDAVTEQLQAYPIGRRSIAKGNDLEWFVSNPKSYAENKIACKRQNLVRDAEDADEQTPKKASKPSNGNNQKKRRVGETDDGVDEDRSAALAKQPAAQRSTAAGETHKKPTRPLRPLAMAVPKQHSASGHGNGVVVVPGAQAQTQAPTGRGTTSQYRYQPTYPIGYATPTDTTATGNPTGFYDSTFNVNAGPNLRGAVASRSYPNPPLNSASLSSVPRAPSGSVNPQIAFNAAGNR